MTRPGPVVAVATDWVSGLRLGLAGLLVALGAWTLTTGRGWAGAVVPLGFAAALCVQRPRTPLRLRLTPAGLEVRTLLGARLVPLAEIMTIDVNIVAPGTRIERRDASPLWVHPWTGGVEHLAFAAARLAPHITVRAPEPEWW